MGEDERRGWVVASSEPLISIVPDSLPTTRGRRVTRWRKRSEQEEEEEEKMVVVVVVGRETVGARRE